MAESALRAPAAARKLRFNSQTIILWLLLLPIVVVLAAPVWYMIAKAFTPEANQYKFPIVWLPDPFTIRNFEIILGDRALPIFRWMFNSAIVTSVGTMLVLLVSAASAYAFARLEFPGRRALQTGILLLTGMPLLTNLIALYQLVVSARRALAPLLGDGIVVFERAALIVIYTGLFLPFSIWIVKGFYAAIPRELEEAAQIDGCTPVGALARVTAPIAAPGLFSAFLLTFVGVWNEFIVNYLIVGTTRPELRSAVVGLYSLTGTNLINYQVLAAACVLIMLPVLALFVAFRGVFFRAMLEGAGK